MKIVYYCLECDRVFDSPSLCELGGKVVPIKLGDVSYLRNQIAAHR